MPGLDRIQSQLISTQLIKDALEDYALVPATIMLAQQTLLAAQLIEKKKKPAVFYSGNHLDAVFSYAPPANSPTAAFWKTAGVTTVKVFNIQDADTVELRFWNAGTNASFAQIAPAFMLGVGEASNPIPLDQACFWGSNQSYISGTTTNFNSQFMGGTIQCAGYKYLHLLGYGINQAGPQDMWALLPSPPPTTLPTRLNNLTYSLIK